MKCVLVIVLLIAMVLRLLVAGQPFQEDEFHWAGSALSGDWFGSVMRNSPLSIYAMQTSVAILGNSVISIRLPFILAGLALIFAVYHYCERNHGLRMARTAALLLAFSPHHALASVQATYEGSFLALFFFLTITSAFERKYCWMGLWFGLALLSKTSALVLLPPLIFLIVLWKQDLRTSVRVTAYAVVSGLLLFFLGFGIPSILAQSPAFINSIAQLASQTGFHRDNLTLLAFQYANAIIWVGPLLVAVPFFQSFKAVKRYWAVVAFVMLFYAVIVRDNFPPMERYLMILLPFLAILAAHALCTRISAMVVGASFALSSALFVSFQYGNILLPFYPKEKFLHHALTLTWNFLVPVTGSSGPVGFYVPFTMIMAGFLLCFFALAAYARGGDKAICLSVVLGIGLAYSAFFMAEYSTGMFHGSIPDESMAVMQYAHSHELPLPVYFMRNYALQFHLNERYKQAPLAQPGTFDYFSLDSFAFYNATRALTQATELVLDKNIRTLSPADDTPETVNRLKQEGGAFLIVDFPGINPKGPLQNFWNTCDRLPVHEKSFVAVCAPT